MKKAKLSLAWQIVIGLVLGVAIGALLNHFSAEKAWWISNVLQPAGDIFIRLIKMSPAGWRTLLIHHAFSALK